jgi:hypothetical protein
MVIEIWGGKISFVEIPDRVRVYRSDCGSWALR